MTRYVVKRVALAVVTIIIISLITFFAMNAIPGGPFNKEKASSPQVQALLEKRYNLDKPVWEQYLLYMGNLMKGDWGVSLKTGRDIWETISTSFVISARLGGGRPLPGPDRSRMEAAFGTGLSHVRLHDDPMAGRLNDAVAALDALGTQPVGDLVGAGT